MFDLNMQVDKLKMQLAALEARVSRAEFSAAKSESDVLKLQQQLITQEDLNIKFRLGFEKILESLELQGELSTKLINRLIVADKEISELKESITKLKADQAYLSRSTINSRLIK